MLVAHNRVKLLKNKVSRLQRQDNNINNNNKVDFYSTVSQPTMVSTRYPQHTHPKDVSFGSYSMKISTLTVTLTMRTAIKNCHKTLSTRPCLVAKLKRFKSSGDMLIWKWNKYFVVVENFSLHCDLDLEDRNPTFSHEAPGHDDTQIYIL